MRVDFYSIYRPVVGAKSIELEDGLSVRQTLEIIVTRYPPLRVEFLDERGELYPWLPVFVNGRNPRLWADGLDRPLSTTDVLAIFSPIASGKINVEDIKKQMTSSKTAASREDVP